VTSTIVWSRRSQQDLRRLDQHVADRVIDAMTRFAEQGQGDVTRLVGTEEFRLRVGDWRVRFVVRARVDEGEPGRVIEVLRVLPRGRAYRDMA
jgi:hypothetical protein